MGQLIHIGGGARGKQQEAVPPAPQWLINHHKALQNPYSGEAPIVTLRSALIQYGVYYPERFESCNLGEDTVLGPAWLQIAKGYLALLNGETGRLDCGTLDGELRDMARRFGFSEAVVEAL